MKKSVTIALAAAALGVTFNYVVAGSLHHEPAAISTYQVLNNVREAGLGPSSEPVRWGPYYVLHAVDTAGVEVRVVADARLGDILAVQPIHIYAVPPYNAGPRIIHVPQAGDNDANDDDTGATAPNDDGDIVKPTPPRTRVKPRMQHRSDAHHKPRRVLPPPATHRTVLSAPPPPLAAPSPIYPMPRYDEKAAPTSDQGEKFAAPKEAAGSSPPAAASQQN